MKKYIGNCQPEINCDDLINEITRLNIEPSHGHMELKPSNPFFNDYKEQTHALLNAGYNDHVVEYRHYQCGKHFNQNIATTLGKIIGASPLLCWISEIRPGKCTPWHWDINPWEEEHKKHGELIRYFCFLSKPAPGHIFVTVDDAYYMEEQGSIYQYSDIHAWHAGSNIGLESKFLLTFTGYQ